MSDSLVLERRTPYHTVFQLGHLYLHMETIKAVSPLAFDRRLHHALKCRVTLSTYKESADFHYARIENGKMFCKFANTRLSSGERKLFAQYSIKRFYVKVEPL